MFLSSLFLKDFRSHDNLSVQFLPGVNIITGRNGSGKTNILESIYVLSRGKSFKAQSDVDLLQFGKSALLIESLIDGKSRKLLLRKTEDRIDKRWQIGDDRKIKSRLSQTHKLRVVLFEPRDMQLLTGSPERRRAFMDDVLDQLELDYAKVLYQYRRALIQRNSLLKQPLGVIKEDHFFVWDVRLSELGAEIIRRRRRLIGAFNERASDMYSLISGIKSEVEIVYSEQTEGIDNSQLESALLRLLESKRKQDLDRGFSSVGPHRDDLVIYLNGSLANISASRGETRSLVVMLKLLEARFLEADHKDLPLVLLDDVFGELDGARRKSLSEYFINHQVIITATETESSKEANIIRL